MLYISHIYHENKSEEEFIEYALTFLVIIYISELDIFFSVVSTILISNLFC